MSRARPFGLTDRERVEDLRRQIEAMTTEQQRLISENDRFSDTLRIIARDPDSGIWGDLAARALRPERAREGTT